MLRDRALVQYMQENQINEYELIGVEGRRREALYRKSFRCQILSLKYMVLDLIGK